MNRNDESEEYLPEMVAPPPQIQSVQEDLMPEQIKKEKIEHSEIFVEDKKEVEEEEEDEIEVKDGFVITPPEKVKEIVKRKKRQMTPAQLEKLAEARKKGQETRRRNAEARKLAKLKEKEEKDLENQVKNKKIARMKSYVEHKSDDISKPKVRIEKVIEEKVVEKNIFSESQLQDAIISAIAGYDTIRKERKSKKKEEAAKKEVFNTITKSIDPLDQWSECFR
tara:strand:- start:448 stop:1116 length:669 start_codon:yes stop_codon:yes gene_type:complete